MCTLACPSLGEGDLVAVMPGDDAHGCHISLPVSLQVTETGPRDVAHAARPTGRALLCLSTYSIRVDKIETRLVSDNARLYNTIQYNIITANTVHYTGGGSRDRVLTRG